MMSTRHPLAPTTKAGHMFIRAGLPLGKELFHVFPSIGNPNYIICLNLLIFCFKFGISVLFTIVSSWVVSSAVEGKNKERETFSGQNISK